MDKENEKLALAGHLKELRKRLVISAIAAVAGFGVCYAYSELLFKALAKPLMPALPSGHDYMAFTGIVEPFFVYLKVGLAGGLILSSPVILYQIWAFVTPGLYRKEKKWFILIVFSSLVLFVSGVLFAYNVVFPFGFKYLLGYATDELKPILSMGLYFSLATKLLIAFGAVFQLPLAMLVLARLGVVTARRLLLWWRYAIVLILVASAILTPSPDVFNQLLMAGPLAALYSLGVLGAWLFGKKKEVAGTAAPQDAKNEKEEDG